MKPIGLSIAETGRVLGDEGSRLSRATIYRMIARGELEAYKIGSRTLITVESIERCVESAPRLRMFG